MHFKKGTNKFMEYKIDVDEIVIEFIQDELSLNAEQIQKFRDNINKIIELAVSYEKLNVDTVYVSISAASKEEIQNLNKEYRKIDRVTDVLSFPVFTVEEIGNIKDANNRLRQVELGDIIMCLDVVKQHSEEYETGLNREMLYMITHGICHLLGYDHIEESDKLKMRALEDKILQQIGV